MSTKHKGILHKHSRLFNRLMTYSYGALGQTTITHRKRHVLSSSSNLHSMAGRQRPPLAEQQRRHPMAGHRWRHPTAIQQRPSSATEGRQRHHTALPRTPSPAPFFRRGIPRINPRPPHPWNRRKCGSGSFGWVCGRSVRLLPFGSLASRRIKHDQPPVTQALFLCNSLYYCIHTR